MTCRRPRGYTLVELLVALAIVGILASVAYPTFRGYLLKSKRAQARAALVELLQQQERHMTQHDTYVEFPVGDPAAPFRSFAGDARAQAPYLLGAQSCDKATSIRDCVRVLAAPQHDDPEVQVLMLNSTGLRECTGARPDLCWR